MPAFSARHCTPPSCLRVVYTFVIQRGGPTSGALAQAAVGSEPGLSPVGKFLKLKLPLVHFDTYRKLHTSFPLVPKLVTLNDLERRNGRYFVLFHHIP